MTSDFKRIKEQFSYQSPGPFSYLGVFGDYRGSSFEGILEGRLHGKKENDNEHLLFKNESILKAL